MKIFAIGPVEFGTMTVLKIEQNIADQRYISGGDVIEDDQDVIEVQQHLVDAVGGNPLSLIGRQVNIAGGAAGASLVALLTEDRRQEWLDRLGVAYVQGMENLRLWWPREHHVVSDRQRSEDVLDYELPNWWKTCILLGANVATRRDFRTMNLAEIEACVAHLENLLVAQLPASGAFGPAHGIIRRWYDVGRSLVPVPNNSAFANGPNGRLMSVYGTPTTFTVVYTDAFEVVSGKLVPRTPDYSWNVIVGATPPAAGFDPEHPA